MRTKIRKIWSQRYIPCIMEMLIWNGKIENLPFPLISKIEKVNENQDNSVGILWKNFLIAKLIAKVAWD